MQDPYSIRCQPQVVGACLDVLRHVCGVLETEANAVTDNPLVFAESEAVLSGGNFHAEPVALAADYLALAIAEIGALSERRIACPGTTKVVSVSVLVMRCADPGGHRHNGSALRGRLRTRSTDEIGERPGSVNHPERISTET